MKRIIIVCEGTTEVEFCKDVLSPHLIAKNISIHTPLIKKSGGGIVHWSNLRKQIENHLYQDKDSIVTSLIDYYGIEKKHEFPLWQQSLSVINKNERMAMLENGMKESISDNIRNRFIPYIQLHEFEALLFNDISIFINQIPENDFIDKKELTDTIIQNPNPELINDTPNNSPSNRLKRLIKNYNKIVYGAILANEIGLTKIRNKCPRFNEWVIKLESI